MPLKNPLGLLRASLELTQTELGDTIGLTAGRVCQIEKGRGALGNESLLNLTDRYRVEIARLGLTVEDFLHRIPEAMQSP